MLATPSSQTGRRARRKTSQTSKPVVSLLLAPRRWHTEAVAVHKLAAMASRIAFSTSPTPRPWPARNPAPSAARDGVMKRPQRGCGARADGRPVRPEIRLRVILGPAVESLGEGGGLPAPRGQVLLQHEHEHHIAFGREVRNVLGDDSPAPRAECSPPPMSP